MFMTADVEIQDEAVEEVEHDTPDPVPEDDDDDAIAG